ncbi:helix-turn-helix domain-containing protein [Puia sp. P3]|uniref:helix-turn-helix domain-containing protein n=1 Tax=Puia sp. P3 TaxID=3423952 RepID=UPI003D66F4A3
MLQDSFHIERLDPTVSPNSQPQRLDDHQLFLITGGSSQVHVDLTTYTLSSGSLLLISKGQVYTFLPAASSDTSISHGSHPARGNTVARNTRSPHGNQLPSATQPTSDTHPLSGLRLRFGDCFWQRTPISASNCKAVLFDDPAAGRLFLPGPADLKDLETLLITTLGEYQTPDYSNKSDVLAAYLKIIIIKTANIHSLLRKDIATYDGRIYQDFLALVRDNYNTAHDVPFFARQLGVTTRKLAAVCRTYGAGAKEIIIEQLISEAKRSLRFSSRSIKEIAGDLGFPSPYQFSSFFKTYTQQSPLDYREQSTPKPTVKIHI